MICELFNHIMEKGFWNNLKRPIIGLSPMDGISDAAFRIIMSKYGKPDVIFTEFVSVEGICAGATKPLSAFMYDETERPIVAQVFGSTPEAFYKAAFVVCELGFDGIDINMGCPSKNIASKGAGASLILTPDLAKKIVRHTKKGIEEWAKGRKIGEVGLPETIVTWVKKMQPKRPARKILPVSIKTRTGYNSNIVEEWVKHLLETEPANISIHGRTLKQMYGGNADWEAIGRAASIIGKTQTSVMGNGDIKSISEGRKKTEKYNLDGVLIGRAALGNPWVFTDKEVSLEKKLAVAVEHARTHEKIFGKERFVPMRKHLAWYSRGFINASQIRQKLMQSSNADEVERILLKP
jgi:nifR3 family TIM-barrel protein